LLSDTTPFQTLTASFNMLYLKKRCQFNLSRSLGGDYMLIVVKYVIIYTMFHRKQIDLPKAIYGWIHDSYLCKRRRAENNIIHRLIIPPTSNVGNMYLYQCAIWFYKVNKRQQKNERTNKQTNKQTKIFVEQIWV